MKKYKVTVEIINGANKGAIVTTELFAKDKDGALYRTHTLLAKEYNVVSIEEITDGQFIKGDV